MARQYPKKLDAEQYVRILEALSEGRNPYTGRALELQDLWDPEIRQALRAGAATLRLHREPERSGKPWTYAEEEMLRVMTESEVSPAEIAQRLNRSERAVDFKIEELIAKAANPVSEEEKKAAMQKVRLRPHREKDVWPKDDLRKLQDMSQSGMDILNIAAYFSKSVEETERALESLSGKR